MEDRNIKKDPRTSGRARNMENKNTQKLWELYKNLKIAADIKNKRLEWIGHAVRMDQGRRVKKIFGSKLAGSRRRGRPRLRWLDDAEKDLQEMKVKSLLQKAVNKEEWASIIKEAKALRGARE
jgi:hypothetical protein